MYPNVKLQLWKTGIRQNRLARTLGIDESLLSKIINGFREPNPEMRRRIAAALGTEEEWLFQSAGAEKNKDGRTPAIWAKVKE